MNYEKIKYPDGSSYVKVLQYEKEFNFRVESYEDLWTLNQLVDVYNNAGLIPTITIPCLLDAQADRRFNSSESFGLKLVVKFLSSINANFKVFHPHNADALEFGANNIEIIDNSEFLVECLSELCGVNSGSYNNIVKDLIIMSPDAGMYKNLMKTCDKIGWTGETYSASKYREYRDGNSNLVQQIDRENFNEKNILIVDDICVGGGTFVGLAKILRERNCSKIYLAVSHTTSDKVNSELFEVFDKVFTTNSKTIVEKYKDQLEIINIF